MGVAIVDANPKSRDWKTTVSQTAAEQFRGELLDGPLAVEFTFRVVRPKGHFGKRGLLPSAPEFPAVKPDLLKLARGVEDALTGIVWRDDSLIVDEVLAKRFGEQAGVEIVIRPLPGRVPAPLGQDEAPLPLFAVAGGAA
jgi:Holliday junction resolvase RusA-like endonuclease